MRTGSNPEARQIPLCFPWKGSIPAGARRLIRVDIPATDIYWQRSAEHASSVSLYLHQRTKPPEDTTAHHEAINKTNGSNFETLNAYPWLPNESYYFIAVNNGAGPETLRLSIAGDFDDDGMQDTFEFQYFDSLDRDGTADYGNDGLADIGELLLGTNPTDVDSDDDGFSALEEYVNGTDPNIPDAPIPVPALSHWGMLMLALLLIASARFVRTRHRRGVPIPDPW